MNRKQFLYNDWKQDDEDETEREDKRDDLKMLNKRQSRRGRNFFTVARTLSGGSATVNQ